MIILFQLRRNNNEQILCSLYLKLEGLERWCRSISPLWTLRSLLECAIIHGKRSTSSIVFSSSCVRSHYYNYYYYFLKFLRSIKHSSLLKMTVDEQFNSIFIWGIQHRFAAVLRINNQKLCQSWHAQTIFFSRVMLDIFSSKKTRIFLAGLFSFRLCTQD